MLDCTLRFPGGETARRCIVLRGGAVVIVPVLWCTETREAYTLMVRQRRIVDGNYTLEFPAGMIQLKEGKSDPFSSALVEVKEELGIDLKEEELKKLTDEPLRVCESLLDEKVHFFYFERHVSQLYLSKVNMLDTGCHDDGEFTQVVVQKLNEVKKNPNFVSLIGLKLIELELDLIF